MHHRFTPKVHHFQHSIFMLYLDLDELERPAKRIWPFSHNRRNLYSFYDSDHEPAGNQPLKQRVTGFLRKNGIEPGPFCRVMLLTFPRVFGYVFNPISIYFCFDGEDKPIAAVAEVGNTFLEKKLYLIGADKLSAGSVFKQIMAKNFYVSPFSGLDLSFDFRFRIPGETLDVQVDDLQDGKKTLISTLAGVRAPLTSRKLLWFTLKYPLVTLKVIFLIHWHALLLWLKGVPFHRKAENPQYQQGVLRPHPTLTSNLK
jgi:hypothetical protein